MAGRNSRCPLSVLAMVFMDFHRRGPSFALKKDTPVGAGREHHRCDYTDHSLQQTTCSIIHNKRFLFQGCLNKNRRDTVINSMFVR